MKTRRHSYPPSFYPMVAGTLLTFISTANGAIVDFETNTVGGLPIDDVPLNHLAPYLTDGVAVTFGFDTTGDGIADTDAVFERRGADFNNGFFSTFGTDTFDTERTTSSQSLGQFFLRQPSAIGGVPGVFVIAYDIDVTAFSGEIWDIDAGQGGFEQWRVSSFDAAGNFIASIESPVGIDTNDPNSLDSLAWVFSLEGNDIRRVEVEYIGNNPIAGLAFDNYNATSAIPEPTSYLLAMISLVRLFFVRSRLYE